MPKKPKPKPGEVTFDTFTVACPKVKRMWRPEVRHELIAWLQMHARRVSAALTHATRMAKEYKTEGTFTACTNLRTRLELLGELLVATHDKWSEYDWLEAIKDWKEIHEAAAAQGAKPAGDQEQPRTEGVGDGT